MQKIFTTIFVFAAAASLGFAQAGPSGTPPTPASMAQHRVSRFASQLNLTAEQQANALAIFTNSATADQSIHTSLQTAHESLQSAIKANSVTNIQTLAAQIGPLMGQLTANDATASAAFYKILTPDQQAKFDQVTAHGPGGPRGFGGGAAGAWRAHGR